MHNVSSQLRAFMDRKGLTQISLAAASSVSQATVSRVLKGKGLRGRARRKLFSYAGIGPRPASRREAEEEMLLAFNKIWSVSDKKAKAVLQILTILADSGPVRRRKVKARRGTRRKAS